MSDVDQTDHTERAREIVRAFSATSMASFDPGGTLHMAITAALTAVEREAIERCQEIARNAEAEQWKRWLNTIGPMASSYREDEPDTPIADALGALVKEGE